jgi:serine/threonine protein kinase
LKVDLLFHQGPFNGEEDFNITLADIFLAKSQPYMGPYIRGMLDSHKHSICFTHGDLRPANIMVKDGRVVAIIDWEMAGWYPEHWEFVKAHYLETFMTDWATHLLDILDPYFCEHLIYSKIKAEIW